jgi:uncharacterized protein
VRYPAGDGGVQRTWSLSDYASDPTTYRISVKREPGGTVSRWLHDEVGAGMELQVRAPAGRFVLDRGAFKPVVLIAAGIGITPLLSMAKSHIARGPSAPPLHFIHCVRDGSSAIFPSELRELAALPGVSVDHVFSQPRPSDAACHGYRASGRLTLDVLEDLLGDTHIIHGGRRINLPWYDCEVYLCGPAAFQDSLLAQMVERGVDTARIRRESFLPPPPDVSASVVQSAAVVLERSGRVLQWSASEPLTLLELLERHSIEWPNVCRTGICHTCRCELRGGEVARQVVTHGVERGSVLLCCSRPASAQLILDA